MDSQSEIFEDLRDKLVDFHGLSESVTTSPLPSPTASGSTLVEEGVEKVVESGSGENVKGTLGRWEVEYSSIWERVPEYGLDARQLYDIDEEE